MEAVQTDENERDRARIERIEQERRWIVLVDPIISTRLSAAEFDRATAGQMAQALHSSLKPKAIDRLLQKVDQNERPAWVGIEFWRKDIDHVLLGGALSGKSGRAVAIRKIRSVWTKLSLTQLEERMRIIAFDNLPPWSGGWLLGRTRSDTHEGSRWEPTR